MKVNAISCTQFAGIRDRSVSFTDGINVIYGKNESGKSTLVHLLSRTLFQNARIDGRSDKEFRELYFPSARKGGAAKGDFADGKISLETTNGTYVLTKEWGADARCLLSTPDGVIRDPKTIDALLREVLVYGEGVYTQLLFSSQCGTDRALQTLLDSSQKTDAKQDIADAVTMAVAESDGVSVDAIEQAIDQKLDELLGKHWDIELGRPVRKTGRWSSGLGEIIKAYYALEDAKAVLEERETLGREAEHTAAAYTACEDAVRATEEAYSAFQGFATSLAVRSERLDKIKRLENEMTRLRDVLSQWPSRLDALARAKALDCEREGREQLSRYEAAKAVHDQKQELSKALSNMPCPSDGEIAAVRTALRETQRLQNQLCGMNVAANIRMQAGHTVEVRSLRTGERLPADGDMLSITEAVTVTVPGVMEMQLSPADVDTAAITARLSESDVIIRNAFEQYEVNSLEALEALAARCFDTRRALETTENRLSMLLGTTAFEELAAAATAVSVTVRSKDAIDADIAALCGGTDVARFITATETVISGFETEYGSVDRLKAAAFDVGTALEKAKSSVDETEDIPEAFLCITDPEAHLAALQRALREKQQLRDAALTAKTAAASRLEAFEEGLDGDPTEAAITAQRRFEEQKELLSHWLHIQEVFLEQKNSLTSNPMLDVADRFARHLQILSGGKVSSEFPEADKLNMQIFSDDRLLDYGKLSEGTKETVSLAFRLAVLDHLFPEGGGVIVLDDPFTDMDAERTAQACALLTDCAKRHQVLFLTCKEEYAKLLGGNVISI